MRGCYFGPKSPFTTQWKPVLNSKSDDYQHKSYQLATAQWYNKYLRYLSKKGRLLQEKEGCDVFMNQKKSLCKVLGMGNNNNR